MKCMSQKICNMIHDFFRPTGESVMEKFAIVEKQNITEEEARKFLKILEEWEEQYIQFHMIEEIDYW